MIDTSAMVAALLPQHEHHELARPHLTRATQVPAVVLAETYAQLRRTFGISAQVVQQTLSYWSAVENRIATLPAAGYKQLFGLAASLGLGANIHDAVVAQTCAHLELPLATLDRRQHNLALAMGVQSTYLLA
ncbi:MAG: PIN domain-containing protein [Actinobacteria bacterium]|nr:PIN domain-containing protein [Actinomycetota bacterium]